MSIMEGELYLIKSQENPATEVEETRAMSIDKKFNQAIRESEAYRAELTRITMLDNLIEMTQERKLEVEKNPSPDNKLQEMRIRHLTEICEELNRARHEQAIYQEKRALVEPLSQKNNLFGPLNW